MSTEVIDEKPLTRAWKAIASHVREHGKAAAEPITWLDVAHVALISNAERLVVLSADLITYAKAAAFRDSLGQLLIVSQAIRVSADVPRQAKLQPHAADGSFVQLQLTRSAAAILEVVNQHWAHHTKLDYTALNEHLYDLERSALAIGIFRLGSLPEVVKCIEEVAGVKRDKRTK